jgi:hypothetical protein
MDVWEDLAGIWSSEFCCAFVGGAHVVVDDEGYLADVRQILELRSS